MLRDLTCAGRDSDFRLLLTFSVYEWFKKYFCLEKYACFMEVYGCRGMRSKLLMLGIPKDIRGLTPYHLFLE
jgi:hypothetical protein